MFCYSAFRLYPVLWIYLLSLRTDASISPHLSSTPCPWLITLFNWLSCPCLWMVSLGYSFSYDRLKALHFHSPLALWDHQDMRPSLLSVRMTVEDPHPWCSKWTFINSLNLWHWAGIMWRWHRVLGWEMASARRHPVIQVVSKERKRTLFVEVIFYVLAPFSFSPNLLPHCWQRLGGGLVWNLTHYIFTHNWNQTQYGFFALVWAYDKWSPIHAVLL